MSSKQGMGLSSTYFIMHLTPNWLATNILRFLALQALSLGVKYGTSRSIEHTRYSLPNNPGRIGQHTTSVFRGEAVARQDDLLFLNRLTERKLPEETYHVGRSLLLSYISCQNASIS